MNHFWWYLARSSGLTAWALVMFSIVVGISVSGRLPSESRTRRHLVDLHPWVSGTALFVVVPHGPSIVADRPSRPALHRDPRPTGVLWTRDRRRRC